MNDMKTATDLLALTTIDGINAMLDATQGERPAVDAAPVAPGPRALEVGDRVRVEKGCAAREVAKNTSAKVVSITPMGADYGHTVKVVLYMLNGRKSGKTLAFVARHINRLSDTFVSMNDGNPSHRIEIRRVAS
jgi:hypothetical protein